MILSAVNLTALQRAMPRWAKYSNDKNKKQNLINFYDNNFIFNMDKYMSQFYCSGCHNLNYLDLLLKYLNKLYKEMSHELPSLTDEKVLDITNSLMNGSYTLSPLKICMESKKVNLNFPKFHHISKIFNFKKGQESFAGFYTTDEDSIVLMGLGCMLNQVMIKKNLLMVNSLGYKIDISSFYKSLCASGNVIKLYKLDLTNSLNHINKENLLSNLKKVVHNNYILELFQQFLNIPIQDDESIYDNELIVGFNIPLCGFITKVLLNFALIDFDNEFRRVLPELYYTRYVHEVYVSFPSSESMEGMTFQFFEETINSILYNKLNLDAKIVSIEPGDEPVSCYGGLVWVRNDGQIEFDRKES